MNLISSRTVCDRFPWSSPPLLLLLLLGVFPFAWAASVPPSSRPNILFIASDDLRPELGCYGVTQAKTPHLDRLARQGVVFTRAYCQQPLCGPTRASLLTGLRPNSTGVLHNNTHFREKHPDLVTLPQHFKNHGYRTMTIGKIFHGGKEDPISWTETLKPTRLEPIEGKRAPATLQAPANRTTPATTNQAAKAGGVWKPGPATVCEEVPDQAYADGIAADTAIAALRKSKDEPFFLAVGFHKPHLSFVAPKKYWDLYDPAALPLARNPFPPKDCPPLALTPSIELRARSDIPKDGPISEELARRLRHGYLACVSYVDAQVGRLLDELEACGLADHTIVVFWGDHGFQLGEHGLWGKAVNFETSARVPLIVSAPDAPGNGRQAAGLVELLDLYPTLCELAGLPRPDHLQGRSFVTLLKDPSRAGKPAAFTQSPAPAFREWAGLPLDEAMSDTFRPLLSRIEKQIQSMDPDDFSLEKYHQHVTGYSIRTDRYRLVHWTDDRQPDTSLALELYDHELDPDENLNLAGQPAYAKTVAELRRRLQTMLPRQSKP